MTMYKVFTVALTATMLTGCLVSVDDPVDPVDPDSTALTMYWTFEGSGACLDVVDVHVTLRDPYGDVYDDDFYPCGLDGLVYDDIIYGEWDVELTALDEDDFILYDA